MALAFADRVRETTTTTGTGTITLAGAVTGYQSFSAIGNGNTTYYTINAGSQWEVGIGTYTASGTTLSRDTVLASSNAGSLVDFSAGTKDVFAGYPAGKVVIQDASGNVGIGTASPGAKLDVAGEIRIYPSSSPAQLRFGVSGVEKGKLAVDSSSNMLFETAGSERMRITSAGYVGVGVTPSASTEPLLQMQNGGMIATAGPYAHFMANAFYGSGGWTYTTSASATRYEQGVGIHSWHSAGSGTAGATVAFTERMRIDSAGNVGIGTSSPSYKLDVTASGSNIRAYTASGNAEILAQSAASGVAILDLQTSAGLNRIAGGVGSTSNMRFYTASTERMIIDSSGNVGIGLSNPGAKLHVAGGGNIRLTATSDGSNGVFQVYDSASSTLFQLYNDSTKANLAVVEAKPMVFYTTNTERMRIASNGNMTVGSTSSFARLASVAADGTYQLALVGTSKAVRMRSDTTNFKIEAVDQTLSSSYEPLWLGGSLIQFGTSTTERMRIDSSGNVGIGTSSPGYKLAVAGTGGTAVLNLLETGVRSWGVRAGGSVSNSFDIADFTAGATRMVIDSSGNMGVGTSSPEARLHVFLSSGVVARFGEASTGAVTNIHNRLAALPTTGTGTNIGWLDSGSGFAAGSLLLGARPAVGLVVLSSSGAADMVVNTSGNVGIGTSSPSQRLDVTVSSGTEGSGLGVTNSLAGGYGSGVTFYSIRSDTSAKVEAGAIRMIGANAWNSDGTTSSSMRFFTVNANTAAERMRITAAGNVGIGTTVPALPLVVSNAGAGGLEFNHSGAIGGGTYIQSYNRSTAAYIPNTNYALSQTWYSGATRAMDLDSSGNLGIGTSSPSAKLDVVTAGAFAAEFNGTNTYVDIIDSTVTGRLQAVGNVFYIGTTAAVKNLGFKSGAGVEAMLITSAGNVGIGTSSPQARLDVNSASTHLAGVFNSTGNTYIQLQNSGVNGLYLQSTTGAAYLWNQLNTPLLFGTNNTEKMRITGAGEVLVNRSSTSGYGKLNVDGGADFTGGNVLLCRDTGNVGIGTASPSTILHVAGSSVTEVRVTSSGNLTTGAASLLRFGGSNSATSGYIGYGGTASTIDLWNTLAGSLTFGTSNLERMRIDSSGNVLVGTTSATAGYLMSVNGALTLANGYSLSWGAYNSGGPTIAGSTNFLAFYPNGASSGEKMRITSAGYVGIGTSSPNGTLTVFNSATFDARTSGINVHRPSSYGQYGSFAYDGGTTYFSTTYTGGGAGVYGAYVFQAYDSTSTPVTRMAITSAGNVGIGTSSPQAMLHVAGGVLIQNANGYNEINFSGNDYTNIYSGTTSGMDIGITSTSSAYLRLLTNNTEQVRITSAGNVGIGTSSPGAKLEVNGSIAFGTSLTSGVGVTTQDCSFELGGNRGGDGNAYIDLHATSGTDYEMRILRGGGANGALDIVNNGTGVFTLNATGATAMRFATSNTERMRIGAGGEVAIATSSAIYTAANRGNLTIGGSASSLLFLGTGGTTGTYLAHFQSNNSVELWNGANGHMAFATNNTERFRITSTGGITSSDLADAVGYKGLPQNSRTTGYTLALSDMGKHISITTGNITIPANGSVAFPVGSAVTIYNNSGSTQTISITTDTLRQAGTTNTGTRTLAAYGVATVLKVASTTWVISGNVS